MSAKTENIWAEVETVQISTNPDKLITKIFLAILLRKWNPHFVFYPLIRNLQAFEILK